MRLRLGVLIESVDSSKSFKYHPPNYKNCSMLIPHTKVSSLVIYLFILCSRQNVLTVAIRDTYFELVIQKLKGHKLSEIVSFYNKVNEFCSN